MRSRTDADLPGRCPRCWLLVARCFCGELPRLRTDTRIVVVRHALETIKTSNTARLAGLVLENVEVVDYGVPGMPFEHEGLGLQGAWLLYPGSAVPLPASLPPPRTLVVPDGNWRQARRMVKRLTDRLPMPRFSLPAPPEAELRMRDPARPDACSTVEAIAAAVRHLDGEAGARAAEVLLAAYRRMTRETLLTRGQKARVEAAGL